MQVFRPFYDSDEGEPDLENGKKRRFKSGWRAMFWHITRQIHRNSKLHASRIFMIAMAVGALLLFGVYLKFSDVQAFSGLVDRSERSNSAAEYPYPHLKNLVMVAGHSVYTSRKCAKPEDENSWFLESYQRHSGQAASFLEHIHKGVAAAARDNESLLLFSGGETRKAAGPRSEAQSYWSVADSNDWFGHAQTVRDRALTEEHARDSFENLLFSICRFRELTGTYPRNITVISYNFKSQRFVGLHRAALKFPAENFHYIGTLPAISSAAAAAKGEFRVQEEFRRDPYGCRGSLHDKRMSRDPFHRNIPYPSGCPELSQLFTFCGPNLINSRLPWS